MGFFQDSSSLFTVLRFQALKRSLLLHFFVALILVTLLLMPLQENNLFLSKCFLERCPPKLLITLKTATADGLPHVSPPDVPLFFPPPPFDYGSTLFIQMLNLPLLSHGTLRGVQSVVYRSK